MASNVVHVLMHMTKDTDTGFHKYYGVLKIYLTGDQDDAANNLAKLVFLSDSSVFARSDLGLTKKHPDFAWASAAMDAFVDSFLVQDHSCMNGFEHWGVGKGHMALSEANAAGGVLVKFIDAETWDAARSPDKPDAELLAALRAFVSQKQDEDDEEEEKKTKKKMKKEEM